jgi:cell division protein FtsW
MSTAITVVGIIFAMMFVAGLHLRYVGAMFIMGVSGILMLIIKGGGYRMQRLVSFLDPFADPLGDGYQVCQGLLALGSGGLRGLGLGKSIQKNLYLPEPQNDFILAIIGEELGYIGVLVLMLVYLILIYRGIRIVLQAPDRFGMLLGSGIVMMIGIQVLLNVAVVTSSMPPTGITLPFVSYGGNALWLFMGSMGILLNISRQIKKDDNGKIPQAAPGPRRDPLIHQSAVERDLNKIRNY